MDELEISGQRYISTRLAGKLHHYHADYIGQLIRGGKVDGQKVGRAWYVHADSLEAYLKKEAAPHKPAPKKVMSVQKIEPKPVEAPVVEEAVAEEITEEEISTPDEGPITVSIVEEKIETPAPIMKVEEVIETREEEPKQIPITKVMPRKTGGLRYIEDNGPLFPAIKRGLTMPREKVAAPSYIREEEIDEVVIKPTLLHQRKSGVLKRATGYLVLGLIVFSAAGLLSSRVVAELKVQTGQPATVQYSVK